MLTNSWVQVPAESVDEDTALVETKARPEQDEEDTDASEPVVPMTLKEAREMFVKVIFFSAGKPDQCFPS